MDPNYIHTEGTGTYWQLTSCILGAVLGSVIYYKTVRVPIKGDIHYA
jgi:hypothetical protein